MALVNQINPGHLDRQIVIQQLSESVGASGYPVETWTTLDTVWASRTDLTGMERFKAEQLSAPFTATWGIYWRADMDPEVIDVPKTRRISYNSRFFDITSAVRTDYFERIELTTLAASKV